MKLFLFLILSITILSPVEGHGKSLQSTGRYSVLETRLNDYISDKNANIGVAVIVDGMDTIAVNGKRFFPMMSVFKFPVALSVARWIDANNKSLYDSICFCPEELREDTYSPMLEQYGKNLTSLSIKELLEWSLIESDNNSADILLRRIGGPSGALSLLNELTGVEEIMIGASEEDMHGNPNLSSLNSATPLAMAALFDRFDTVLRINSQTFSEIAKMLERCSTGSDRISAPFEQMNVIIGHKTGTGFGTPDGGISALNDCGYIHLPDGRRYTLTVFISESSYGIDVTSKMIAELSSIVLDAIRIKE